MHLFDAVPATNTKVKTLEDLAPVIELYHHMVRAGNLDEAVKLFYDRLSKPTYYQFGAYQLRIELLRALFLDGEDKPPRLKDERRPSMDSQRSCQCLRPERTAAPRRSAV